MQDIQKTYDQTKESDIYKLWEASGYFNPDNLEGKPFTIMMPPPNANNPLHLGHAMFLTLEDIMIRFSRMIGKKTLWLPGTDHAGFETQVVFEKKLEKEGRSRFQMTREQFYKESYDFAMKNKKITEDGIRRAGASCDWTRNTFTLDPKIVSIVYGTFKQMYDDGLIYRGSRICNWCVKHRTALSDLETKYEERKDALYYIKYGPFTLATVRPETKFGDTAVAVHPKDKRYAEYVGKEIEVDGLLGKFKITVIADEAVDQSFGTGVVKVTPAHDAADFEIWQRHKDEIPGPLQVIDFSGRMNLTDFGDNESAKKYHGLKVMEARARVVEDLKTKGLLEKIDENYVHNVQLCYKCSNVIEPLILPQWFVAMTKTVTSNKKQKTKKSSLRDMAVEAIKKKKIKIIPARYEKVFLHWMKNLRDWPISRQIWWGIPIPVKYCEDCDEAIIDAKNKIISCTKCDSQNLKDDPDTFDTWFSSGQWPYATLMAQKNSKFEIRNSKFSPYYPTDVLETGWDILFFWVARMIMLGLYKTGDVPFKYVYLHGLLRDKDRQKMSKSKGNVIDPLGMIDTYGADAVRMSLVIGNLAGNDLVIGEEKIRGYRNFANKVWNASRFVLQNTFDYTPSSSPPNIGGARGGTKLSKTDEQILKKFQSFAEKTTKKIEKFDFAHAAEDLYHYFWHEFADKLIEQSKVNLASPERRESTQKMLHEILQSLLKMLHPFMPFVTESIWQIKHRELLMIEKWPTESKGLKK